MDKKILIVIAAVIIIVAAGAAVAVMLNDSDDDKKDLSGKSFEDTRLRVFGNANGDDIIDSLDKDVIQHIIDCNTDDDTTNDIDWQTEYPFADANNDNKIDAQDIAVVDKIINKESTKMYYYNFYKRVTYVNYPIGQKIGSEYLNLQLLPAIHSYGMLTATDDTTPSRYSTVYPGITTKASLGTWNEISMETLTKLYNDGTVNTLLQWTGGQNTDYLWDNAVASGLADKISFVIVPCQGPDVIQGVLELACMLGDQSLSDDYKAWYDKAITLFDQIDEQGVKKTVTAVRMYNKNPSSIAAFGSNQGPALWFNKVINFQSDYVGKTNFTTLGSIDSFNGSATDEIVVMTQKNCDWSEYNSMVEEYLTAVYSATTQYKNEKMYVVDFEIMPFAAGPAGCYILAAHLYPELFNLDDALNFLQEYLDNFAVRSGANAHEGYTYTGSGYSS